MSGSYQIIIKKKTHFNRNRVPIDSPFSPVPVKTHPAHPNRKMIHPRKSNILQSESGSDCIACRFSERIGTLF